MHIIRLVALLIMAGTFARPLLAQHIATPAVTDARQCIAPANPQANDKDTGKKGGNGKLPLRNIKQVLQDELFRNTNAVRKDRGLQ